MEQEEAHGEQLALLPDLVREKVRQAQGKPEPVKPFEPAEVDPVASVLVDVALAHLDRPFDYLVPAKYADTAVPGARVKVRFAGKDVDGYVVERKESSDHTGRLAPLRRVVSPEPVLAPQVAALSGAVAARYAGTRSDVLRLAVPPRHAATEKAQTTPLPAIAVSAEECSAAWSDQEGGTTLVEGFVTGASPRVVWSALPGADWPAMLAAAAAAAALSGRGVLLCVPDHRDVARLDEALGALLGVGRHVVLTADVGPAARYAAFLRVSRGEARIVVGTRAAAFAPVRDLGLVAIWDDGDDLYAEPRAPYPHTREVLLQRAQDEGAGVIIGGFGRTVEAAHLLEHGWADELAGSRENVRKHAPLISITGATDTELARDPFARSARLPSSAHATMRECLRHGPVLVQTPRQGYAPGLVCETCRAGARCSDCSGPLRGGAAHEVPACRWCGKQATAFECPECRGRGLRAVVVGDVRTAEELGRAFPRIPVVRSSGDRVLASVTDRPALVVATPGAEPVAEGGYAAVVLLDTWLSLSRGGLRSQEEALRRWFNAAALARPATAGGRVVAVGDPGQQALQALVRWDPAGFAERESDERASAHLPPASRLAVISGEESAVAGALADLRLPPGAEVFGPVGTGEGTARLVVRVPRRFGPTLSRALVEMQGVRAARKLPGVRVQVDPYDLD
jgi:primosomal protein N' (replication factor Y)